MNEIKRETLREVLMRRDGLTNEEVDEVIEQALEDLRALFTKETGLDEVEFFMEEYFGLEPDYLEELLEML